MHIRYNKSSVSRYLFYIYLVFLVLLSVLPINSTNASLNHVFIVSIRLDYMLHCLVYIPLAVLMGMNFSNLTFLILTWRIVLLLIFAALNECIQYIIPYRSFNINDLIANCLGVLLGLFVLIAIALIRKNFTVKSLFCRL
jgi:VanZ family protein